MALQTGNGKGAFLAFAVSGKQKRRSRAAPPHRFALIRVHSRLELHAVGDDVFEFVDGDADLLHGVAVAQGDGVVFQGLEVDGDAARRVGLYRKYSGLPTGMICSG